ncbi:competence type IV pilus minor pilin ComGD [Gracilibacillus phocaeensis]|uniref:competence type IV pilus minor pilin ComGD n=1 Tax=Gracilibacillus phocaeensis TaxID=2042304 RepID=UPI00102F8CF8|nr:competence type IV pilus minor pilin ComGD [Gracilibacillus phocaeensis]
MRAPQAAFTLVELLLVLTMTIFILMIGSNITYKWYDTWQEQGFLQQFHQDVFYLQQLALTEEEEHHLMFYTDQNKYMIQNQMSGEIILEREIPRTWVIRTLTLGRTITFSYRGNLKKPGTMSITTTNNRILITCPFGKGRCYHEKK